jgi:hypothetical protein
VARSDATPGTPYAPCGRWCRSHGYDYRSDRRQYGCGLPCPWPARERCPHGQKVRGYTPRMSCAESPRLLGPMQRGTAAWPILSAARTASERTNRYDQRSSPAVAPKLRAEGLALLWGHPDLGPAAPSLIFRLRCTSTLGQLPLAKT